MSLSRLKAGFGIADAAQFLTVVRTLALAQFRLRYLDTALSYVWAVARPALMFGVLYAVFTIVGHFDRGVPYYGPYVFMAIVLWTYFADATGAATSSLVSHGQLLRKVPLPPVTIPLGIALTSLLDLAMSMIAVLVFIVAAGDQPRLSWLELPALVAALTVLVAGVSLILSAEYVRYRDVDQIWIVIRQILFYTTPIIYVATTLHGVLERILLLNPVAVVITQARHALIDPHAPTAAQAAGGYLPLIAPAAVTAAILVLGVWTFRRRSPWLAEAL